MNKSIANWNYLFTGTKQGLIQQSASTSDQSYSHSKSRFFLKKKKKKKNHHHSCLMNKSSSFLVHLHLLHLVIIKKKKSPFSKGKISNEQIFNKNLQNFNGKISKNKSSRKNLHEQIFKRKNLHFSKEKSPKPYSKGKISMNKSS